MDDHPHPLAAARDVLAALLFHMVPSGGRWFQQQRVFFFSGNKSLLLRAGKSIVRAVAAVLMSALKHESEPELLLGYTAFLHAVGTRFVTVPPGQGNGEEGQPSKLFLLQLALRVCDVILTRDIIADRIMAPMHTVGVAGDAASRASRPASPAAHHRKRRKLSSAGIAVGVSPSAESTNLAVVSDAAGASISSSVDAMDFSLDSIPPAGDAAATTSAHVPSSGGLMRSVRIRVDSDAA